MSRERRSNLFEIMVYPDDSLPDYWEDIINETRVACAVSPVHNLDRYTEYDFIEAQKLLSDTSKILDPNDYNRLAAIKKGANKKVHRHIVVNFGANANKTIEQVQALFCIPLNGKKIPRFVDSERGAFRYLIHLDHPEKAQYSRDDIRLFNGYDPKDFLSLSSAQVDNLSTVITQFCDDNLIKGYAELERVTRPVPVWHKWVISHTIFLTAWFRDPDNNYQVSCDLEAKKDKLKDFVGDLYID